MEDLVNILASAIGSLTNPKKLQNAFLIDVAIRYDIKSKKYISMPMKIYFVDPGLRNARLGFRQIEETHLMENIIYNELKRRGYSVDVGLIELRESDDSGRSELSGQRSDAHGLCEGTKCEEKLGCRYKTIVTAGECLSYFRECVW